MGRIFEKRKHKMFARFDKMAKAFSRIGKDIAIAVKQNGPNPDNNPRLRMAIQNAKGVNMPKDRVDAAIKRASSKEEKDFQEVIYEGYAPHGVPVVVECATDNPTRTVANVRLLFSKNSGAMGNSGSVMFLFERRGVFKFDPATLNLNELELDLIDAGAEEIQTDDEEIVVYTKFTEFGHMQKFLESKNLEPKSSELQYIPTTTKELSEVEQDEVMECVSALEADDDVQTVYHNLA
ncbi:MAG: YebC/PmpR family DNA-binding transcriptional regulator [Cyclobacteriaceae bacterium]|nr:YebC/PmpR family DNA-binding transcriptional regulator [Cyclobacteriaceae bacterium]